MKSEVQKWGNSLAVRIPKAFAQETQLSQGSAIEVSVSGGNLIIAPLRPTRYRLAKLLQGVTPRNLHAEQWSDAPQGHEVW
jgi:antitoxin MazE